MGIWDALFGRKADQQSSSHKPDGTMEWTDRDGKQQSVRTDPRVMDQLLKSGLAKRVYRIRIKDAMSPRVREEFWELTPDQVDGFVDSDETAHCLVFYVGGKPEVRLVRKDIWNAVPGYFDP